MATNAFLALACLARQRQCNTDASGCNSGTSVFVGVLTTDLRPANNRSPHFWQRFRTKACEAHESSPSRGSEGTLVVLGAQGAGSEKIFKFLCAQHANDMPWAIFPAFQDVFANKVASGTRINRCIVHFNRGWAVCQTRGHAAITRFQASVYP